MPTPYLPERFGRILDALVRAYIDRGEPVSSLWLARRGGFALSSATVRGVLAGLEAAGYVRQPHTSAGRVPTDLGYRCYVNTLLEGRRPARAAADVEARLRGAGTVDDVLSDVSRQLARALHHVGFAIGPEPDAAALRHIEFVRLGGSKVLVVVVTTDGRIAHKVIEDPQALPTTELSQAANYLNREFQGLALTEIRAVVLRQLGEERTLYDTLVARALRLASDTLQDVAAQDTIFIQGTSTLLDDREAAGAEARDTLRALLRMIEEKHRLVRLLTEYIEGPGVVVVIGAEHSAPDLRRFSLVAARYTDGRRTGTVGVIGPTRMRYSRAITAVESVSQAVSHVLGAEA